LRDKSVPGRRWLENKAKHPIFAAEAKSSVSRTSRSVLLKKTSTHPHPMITRLIIAVAVASLFAPVTAVRAEHPMAPPPTTRQMPVNRTPQPPAQPKEVSTRDISAGIKKHIAGEKKKAGDKKFHVTYKSQDLALDLIKVHDDRLSNLGGGKYFACVDMKATDAKTYDIDFFLTGSSGNMKVTETSVHKINGKPFYNWKEDGGVWKKVKA
jgi:hypothetical protein